MAEKYGFATEEVSAKTGEKVFECIRDLGVGIAKTKMEKSGLTWYTQQPNNSNAEKSGNTGNTNSPSVSGVQGGGKESVSPNKVESKAVVTKEKEAPKPAVVNPTETIKITGKKNVVPSYQKKCC